jgi:hypothetical protein
MIIFFLILAAIVLLIIGGMVWQTGRARESFPGEGLFHLTGARSAEGRIHMHQDHSEHDD